MCKSSTFCNAVPRKGGSVIRVRIQYDKYNRMFKLLDNEFGPLLDDGGVYELPVSLCEFCPNHDLFISRSRGAPAHVAAGSGSEAVANLGRPAVFDYDSQEKVSQPQS